MLMFRNPAAHAYERFRGPLSCETKVHVIHGAQDSQGIQGGWSGGFDGGHGSYGVGCASSSSDSYRYALLLSQLYSDAQVKSVWGSLINLLAINRQV